jgi:hypothetical protein
MEKLMDEYAASYLQDAVHILETIRDFARTPTADEARSRTFHMQVMALCSGLLVKIKRDGKTDLARSVPECMRILASYSGSLQHQWNVATELLSEAQELLDRLPQRGATAPHMSQRSRRSPST